MSCLVGVVILVVDAQDDGQVHAVGRLGRSGDDDLFGPAHVAVYGGLLAVAKDAGRLDHDVHAKVTPGQLGRVALGKGLDLFAVDDELALTDLDIGREAAIVRVIFEQIGQHLSVGQVVYGNDLHLFTMVFPDNAIDLPADSPETVDSNFD